MLEVKILTILVFILTYILFITFYNWKILIVWISVLVTLLIGSITMGQALGAIDWNVIMLYFGMLFVSAVFIFSKMPDYIASFLVSKSKNNVVAMVMICAFSGVLSIFLENVAVVLLVAPIAMSIAKEIKINPIHLFTGIAISSNLQGCATLIGDPPSMLLASFANLKFNDFFFLDGKPSIFFAIQLGFIAGLIFLYFVFKRDKSKKTKIDLKKYRSIIPSILILLLIVSLVASSLFFPNSDYILGIICMIYGLLFFIWYIFHTKKNKLEGFLLKLDWQTGLFLIGLFILVESLNVNGVLNDIAKFILVIGGGNVLLTYLVLIIFTLILSSFVDNIPYLLSMLPVVKVITESMNVNPILFYFGLLIAVSVGGNITPIGASANIVAMGIVKSKGYKVKFMDFVKIGLPFTLIAVLISLIFVWLFFG